jgi:hypothetical protein
MKMNLVCVLNGRLLAGLLLMAVSALPVKAKEEWLPLMPEKAVAVLAIKNVPELVADWDKSPIGRFMADPAVEKWLAPSFKNGEAPWDKWTRETSGGTLRQDMLVYPGASMVAFLWPEEKSGREAPLYVSLNEVGGKPGDLATSKARQFEVKMKANGALKKETVAMGGVTVSVLVEGKGDEAVWADSWAEVKGVLVEANDRATMEQMIAALQKGGAGAVGEGLATNFKRFREIAEGDGDMTIYVDATVLLEKLTASMKSLGGAGEQGASPFSPELILSALSLNEIRGFGVSMDLQDDLSKVDAALLHREKPQGLIVKMLHGSDTKVALPAFVPADVASASVTRWSFLGLYDGLIATLNQLGPMLGGMVQMQLGAFEQQVGMKLREDLFATMDDEIVQVGDFAKAGGEASQVVGIKLKDAVRFGAAFESLKGLAGNGLGVFEESDVAGFKVWKLKANLAGAQAGSAQSEFAYTIAKDYFLLCTGPVEVLHKVLNRMADPAGPSLWDKGGVKTAMAALPANYTGVGVSDGSAMVKNLLTVIMTAQDTVAAQVPKGKAKGKAKGSDKDEASSGTWFDPKAKPGDAVFERYFGISSSGSYSREDAVHYRIISLPVEAQ